MKRIFILLLFSLCVTWCTTAQTPTDALMMKKMEYCFALLYDQGSWDEYWEGTTLRTNATVATVSRYAIQPMVAIGLHDKVNAYVSVPYVWTESREPNGGKAEGQKGFQDLSLALKAQAYSHDFGLGKFKVFASAGFSTPISNYLSDYRPYSIGFGANEINARAIAQLQISMGLYVRGSAGYLWRGQTQVERDYYYNNGSYYTDMMDVPSAWNYLGTFGYRSKNNTLQVEVTYSSLVSSYGDDIRAYNAPQPTNKVNEGRISAMAQYYLRPLPAMSIIALYNQVTSGRNTGKSSGFGAGITYIVNFRK
jgi:hypothetical protein